MVEKRNTDKWQSDRTYNIPNILAALAVVGSFSGWLIFETSRITTLEVQQAYAKEEVIKVAAQAKDDLARVASLLHDNQQEVAAALIRIESRQLGGEKPPTK
jgi:Na+/phosphate symporter